MAQRTDSGIATVLAIGVFIAVVATWVFISPAVIRSAWMTERGEVYALAGKVSMWSTVRLSVASTIRWRRTSRAFWLRQNP